MNVLVKTKTSNKSSSKIYRGDMMEDVPQKSKIRRKSLAIDNPNPSKIGISFFERLDLNKEKLYNLRNLEPNWNFADALPFTRTLIDKVENLLEHLTVQPKIFPTGRQSIQFEYEKSNGEYLEFEIFEDSVVYLLIKNDTEIEKQIPLDDINFNKIINNFYANLNWYSNLNKAYSTQAST
jgi:hypothetical protein